MEALGSGLLRREQCGVGVPGSVRPMPSTLLPIGLKEQELLFLYLHCTVMLTVAVLLAMLGSSESAMVAAFSIITVPDGAVTFTVNRTVPLRSLSERI